MMFSPVRSVDVEKAMSLPSFYKNFRKIVGDVYLHHEVADNPEKITEALLMRCPGGVLRGFAALRNMGFSINHEDWVPMISIPREASWIRVHSGRILRLVEKNIVIINGQRSVSGSQAVVDVLTRPDSWGRWNDGTRREEQIALLDHLLRQDLSLRKELLEDPRTQSLTQHANPLAESRPESIVRWRLHEAGFREWKPQIKVRGRGRFYFVDLGDPTLRVGVEYQGAHHFDREERAKDAQRANDLSWAGWVIIEATSKILSSESAWQELLGHVREEVDLARQQRNGRLPRYRGAA